ncbi:MAG TPA: rhodanese-like domain-containing protein [Cryomorphaceae bacterium]|nr:rhodanese-like domain-containing protein [Cryomorphaceae bacterium]|tara:strand:+ start:2018 stop:2422 length:405 start_codon:yes stop_codon:yes gene_type:complete
MQRVIHNIIVILGLVTAGCQAQNVSTGGVNIDVNVADFAAGIDNADNALVLDVRADAEFVSGHLNGAIQIDFYRDDFQETLSKLNMSRPVFVYCRSGNRSGKAAKQMKALGFKEVYNLEGGIGEWARRGQPVAK